MYKMGDQREVIKFSVIVRINGRNWWFKKYTSIQVYDGFKFVEIDKMDLVI
jgi:hypothetical protein